MDSNMPKRENSKRVNMTNQVEKMIRVITFSRKQEDWRRWSCKFVTFATVKGYQDVLLRNIKAPREDAVINPNNTQDVVRMVVQKANQDAYMALILTCEDNISFGAVDEAVSNDLPSKNAAHAWWNLRN